MALAESLINAGTDWRLESGCTELLDSVRDILFAVDWEGTFLWANAAVETVLGYSKTDMVGRNLLDLVAPDHAAAITARLDLRKTDHDLKDFFEFEVITRNGERRWLETNGMVLFRDGEAIGIQGVARDVTDRKRLEEQLRKAQALEAMGMLAGGIAHDFNNTMTVILGHSRILASTLEAGSAAHGDAAAIQAAADHAAGLTRQLTVISRGRSTAAVPVALNASIEHIRPLLEEMSGAGVKLEIELDAAAPLIMADSTQLEQVVLNLAANAREAMPSGGTLSIRTSGSAGEGGRPRVVLTVRDTGAGIPRPLLDRIFQPFVTTRAGRMGGIGLFVVREIVRQCRAEIEVSSTPGAGTEFRIEFPAAGKVAFLPVAPPAGTGRPPRSASILVADDDEAVLASVKGMLEAGGHKVRTVNDGLEAERVLNAEPFDLLLTDLVMPEREGIETIVALRKSFPKLGIIAMSGAYHGLLLRSAVMLGADAALDKPFERENLLALVQKVLKSRPGMVGRTA